MMRLNFGLSNLIAAVHTPFDGEGELNLNIVEKQAEGLLTDQVSTVFVAGTTGECTSLTIPERLALAERWFEVAKGTPLQIIVHVGTNCLKDSQELATHAQRHGALAISAYSPSYFKPANVDVLVQWCQLIARHAAVTPFYFYDIPSLTGVKLDMARFLTVAHDTIPTLAGLKFSHSDLVMLQDCLAVADGQFEVLFGVDEMLMSALVLGIRGAVGSTYNFAAPLYHDMMKAYAQQDFKTARKLQLRSVKLVQLLVLNGFFASAKALMTFKGIDVGPPRLPHPHLEESVSHNLYHTLVEQGYL